MPAYVIDLASVLAAAARILGRVHRTPMLTCRSLDELAGRRLYLKAENLQRVGAFKARGAMNAVLALTDAEAQRGVLTHSSGNHAAALALAARERGVPAYIVMPGDAPMNKRAAVAGYGGIITLCDSTMASREAAATAIQEATGARLIHPFDNAEVMAGQGTLALEMLEDVPDLDAIIAPISGGGLISGIAIAARGLRPELRVFAAEPTGADDAARSLAAGRRLAVGNPETIADGLRASVGGLTWPILRDLVEGVHLVDDPAIIDAMRLLFERARLVVEPSGATALAATFSKSFRALDGVGHVGVVLSGGNVDLAKLPWLT